MNRHRKIVSSVFVIAAGVAGFMYAPSDSAPQRGPAKAAALETENIRILKSIPLMRGYEKAEKNEPEVAAQLIDIFGRFAARNKNNDGSLNRGTHAKGSCFAGDFQIFNAQELQEYFGYEEDLIARLKRGLYAHDGHWPATLRFANADGLGRVQDDSVADVRGFSFSVQTPTAITDRTGRNRQDYMLNSTAAFATGGVHDFLGLVKAANILIYKDLTYFPNLKTVPAVIQALKALNKGNNSGGGTQSYATQNYWGNLPYSHGQKETSELYDVVKYKVTPCDGKGTQSLKSTEGLDPDYLQKDILARAENNEVCFYFQVQFFDLKALQAKASSGQKKWSRLDWIENGGLGWDEVSMPFYTVAKVEIPSPAKTIDCSKEYINTRLHSSPHNQPLGSIARVRTLVEETSRARRMGELH